MHGAAQAGHRTTIELLLNSGADIEAKDDETCTPLMRAMDANKPDTVVFLVTRFSLLNDGMAATAGAASGSISALKALMTSPQWLAMSRTERVQAECRLFHNVKDKATLDAVRSLVLHLPALVQCIDPNGHNALHAAAHQGRAVPLICALIKEGVDPSHTSNAGHTPADKAHEAGHTLQATLLDRAAEDKRKRNLQLHQRLLLSVD